MPVIHKDPGRDPLIFQIQKYLYFIWCLTHNEHIIFINKRDEILMKQVAHHFIGMNGLNFIQVKILKLFFLRRVRSLFFWLISSPIQLGSSHRELEQSRPFCSEKHQTCVVQYKNSILAHDMTNVDWAVCSMACNVVRSGKEQTGR